MRILIVGDVHGQLFDLAEMLSRAKSELRVGAALQVGDFGFFPEILDPEAELRFPVPVYAIDGNHENHPWLSTCVADGTTRKWRDRLNLHYQPRGSLARIDKTTVGFLGGALHVDRPQHFDSTNGVANYILNEDIEKALGVFNGARPDIIVTHSCPSGIGIGIQGNPLFTFGVAVHIAAAGFDPGPENDCGDIMLSRLHRSLEFRPAAWVFGHFHTDHRKRIDSTDFLCVAGINRESVSIWDTVEKKLLTLTDPVL